jgi:hypothetical protein
MKKLFLMLAVLVIAAQSSMVFALERDFFPEGTIYSNSGRKAFDYGPGVLTERGYKKGVACCTSYMAIIKTGNCGIGDAMKNGDLKRMKYIDFKTKGWFFARKHIVEAYGD